MIRERDAKDYAIEFGEYLATDVTAFLKFLQDVGSIVPDQYREAAVDHVRGLNSAIYEFRKRANRARPA